ncbi:MAG: thioredoxin family protein [Pseudonocardiales bacterium]|nr:thioredoxin family protein [Actinomycetota bacterium]PZS21793.1 MAG: thioredoxin family protein [Pseudonocardiales bacterium]
MAVNSMMVPLGTPAPPFALPSLDGEIVTSDGLAPGRPVLVMFLSNHCPYVRHLEQELGWLVAEYAQDVAAVAICSNDIKNYPADGPDGLIEQSHRAGFTFPYLFDDTQQVALAYHAACTPDFFLYDIERKLVYRGEFDESRPRNNAAVTGSALRAALRLVLAGQPVPEPQVPSMGCGIKWKPGNEPS